MSVSKLQINGESWAIEQVSDLSHLWAALSGDDMLDIWMTSSDGVTLASLVNPKHGVLIFMTPEHPEGWHSLAPNYPAPLPAYEEFRIANGQVDALPVDWCLARKEIAPAYKTFYENGQRPAPPRWAYDGEGAR